MNNEYCHLTKTLLKIERLHISVTQKVTSQDSWYVKISQFDEIYGGLWLMSQIYAHPLCKVAI